jgi:hypothetical protein
MRDGDAAAAPDNCVLLRPGISDRTGQLRRDIPDTADCRRSGPLDSGLAPFVSPRLTGVSRGTRSGGLTTREPVPVLGARRDSGHGAFRGH